VLFRSANADQEFTKAAGAAKARIQQNITMDGGEPAHYWTIVDGGTIQLGVGDVENPDATITQSYETAVALARREANPVTSFMMGKIKVEGNMNLLIGLAGALGKLADVMSRLDVEY